MRAIDIHNGTGDADALFLSHDVAKPQAGAGQALVRVRAFGLNRMDLLQREGRYPLPPQAGPILGVEFSGVVVALGDDIDPAQDATSFAVGDEVFGLAYGGAYAEWIAVSTRMLMQKPPHLSWEQAAGVPETWITATQALHLVGEFSAGKSVLWHAGASSVSIAGIQLSRAAGASAIFVTAGSQDKIDFCVRELGATAGFNYHTQDWADEILAATDGRGVDIIVDFVGAPYFAGCLRAAARDGRIVNLGAMGGTRLPAGVDVGAFVGKRLRYEGSSLRSRDADYQGRLRDRLETYLPRFEDGSFKIFVEKVFDWEKIVDAHKLMESNKTKGKIICTIDN
ncbi:MAG: hypothetical protein M1818_004540 [Claussenomyces sp. TS43310]|nr:MAG: hypothetical protein M1818_004540 [Claussenomyces sp. TS43310]